MAHFAKLDAQNRVIAVVVGRDEDDENELSARTGDTYKKTSYNTSDGVHYGPDGLPDGKPQFRWNYAGIGMIYNPETDRFEPPFSPEGQPATPIPSAGGGEASPDGEATGS